MWLLWGIVEVVMWHKPWDPNDLHRCLGPIVSLFQTICKPISTTSGPIILVVDFHTPLRTIKEPFYKFLGL